MCSGLTGLILVNGVEKYFVALIYTALSSFRIIPLDEVLKT